MSAIVLHLVVPLCSCLVDSFCSIKWTSVELAVDSKNSKSSVKHNVLCKFSHLRQIRHSQDADFLAIGTPGMVSQCEGAFHISWNSKLSLTWQHSSCLNAFLTLSRSWRTWEHYELSSVQAAFLDMLPVWATNLNSFILRKKNVPYLSRHGIPLHCSVRGLRFRLLVPRNISCQRSFRSTLAPPSDSELM